MRKEKRRKQVGTHLGMTKEEEEDLLPLLGNQNRHSEGLVKVLVFQKLKEVLVLPPLFGSPTKGRHRESFLLTHFRHGWKNMR